jgi:hypothetical protein
MPFNRITDKTIPTFWAILLLFSLFGVFIVDSYNTREEKDNSQKEEVKAEVIEEKFSFEAERNIPLETSKVGEGTFKGEFYSYKGIVEMITDFYLIFKTEENELVKAEIGESVSFYQVVEKGEAPEYLDFKDLKKGDEVEINFLKKQGEIEFKTYAVIAKKYE